MTIADSQRAALVDALRAAGPDAPTLCEGWTAHDLAAHLWLREREPLSQLGNLIPRLAGRTRQRMDDAKAERPFEELVDEFADAPGRLSPFGSHRVGDLVNGAEYFIHCEDARRGTEPWEPRSIDPATGAWLWAAARRMAPGQLRRAPVAVVLENTSTGDAFRIGRGSRMVTVAGEPGEFVLFLSGRSAALLQFYGDADAVAELRAFHPSL